MLLLISGRSGFVGRRIERIDAANRATKFAKSRCFPVCGTGVRGVFEGLMFTARVASSVGNHVSTADWSQKTSFTLRVGHQLLPKARFAEPFPSNLNRDPHRNEVVLPSLRFCCSSTLWLIEGVRFGLKPRQTVTLRSSTTCRNRKSSPKLPVTNSIRRIIAKDLSRRQAHRADICNGVQLALGTADFLKAHRDVKRRVIFATVKVFVQRFFKKCLRVPRASLSGHRRQSFILFVLGSSGAF